MRNLGLILLAGGFLAFFYCTTRLSGLEPVPDGVAVSEYLRYDAGVWELGRYAAAVAGLIGLLMSFFPKGR
jgi:hypothetical protein